MNTDVKIQLTTVIEAYDVVLFTVVSEWEADIVSYSEELVGSENGKEWYLEDITVYKGDDLNWDLDYTDYARIEDELKIAVMNHFEEVYG